jgi:ankyrin repeat protein
MDTLCDPMGRTALYIACSNGAMEVVQFFIDNGANIETPNKNGWTPLNSASYNGQLSVVDLLISKGANIETPNIMK